jgi:hypothetical protein
VFCQSLVNRQKRKESTFDLELSADFSIKQLNTALLEKLLVLMKFIWNSLKTLKQGLNFMFGAADCESIIKELSPVRVWISLLTCFMLLNGRVLVVLYQRPRRIVSKRFRGSRGS